MYVSFIKKHRVYDFPRRSVSTYLKEKHVAIFRKNPVENIQFSSGAIPEELISYLADDIQFID